MDSDLLHMLTGTYGGRLSDYKLFFGWVVLIKRDRFFCVSIWGGVAIRSCTLNATGCE